ncbi:MAG: cyclic nucleotide-binding domain-containing protein [Bacteroidota bacterium]
MKSEINSVVHKLLENKNIGLRCYKKGHILQRKGDENSKLYLVKHGLVRSYDIDDQGKLYTFSFASSGNGIYDPKSIITNQPSELFLDVLEDSVIGVINLNSLDSSTIPSKAKDIIISILNTSLYTMQNRIIKMMSASALERYEYFVESHREIANKVPQWMIASYLGIAPETLSAVKGKYYRERKSA